MHYNMKTTKGEEPTGTGAEACAYLNTVSLTAPMDHDWRQIYLFVAAKTYSRWQNRRRTTARQESERNERRQKKEEEVAKRELEQPALFEF